MLHVTLPRYGGPDVLTFAETARPAPSGEQLLIRVRAIGVNRADGMQRQGLYPMPPGVGDIPGIEIAGEVAALGPDAAQHRVGDRVLGLVAEGGYAEYALMDQGLAVTVPPHWSFVEAAAVIEAYCTAGETLFGLGELRAGESVLIHAAGSGVGTAAVQMARHSGARVLFTAGSQRKIAGIRALGGETGIDYKTHDFVEEAFRATGGAGVDVILDAVGGDYLMRNIALLRERGRLVLIGVLSRPEASFDIRPMFRKRLTIRGFTLRAQPLPEKREVVRRFAERWLPLLAAGAVKPVVHAALPFAEVRRAHAMMEANENLGKIVLTLE
jgi:putative PIG3 family NAD(P)H quinone oxidoreductase